MAPRFAAHAPFAEMFAVIREHVVAIFAKPRTSSMHDFISVELAWILETKPNRAPPSELKQSNLFYRPSTQPKEYSAVLHDPAARVVPDPRCLQGGAGRRRSVQEARRHCRRNLGADAYNPDAASPGVHRGVARALDQAHDRGGLGRGESRPLAKDLATRDAYLSIRSRTSDNQIM